MQADSTTGLTTRTAAVLAYLGWWVTGLIFWAVERRDLQVRFHIPDEAPHLFAGVVTRTVVMDIPKGPLNRIGIGTIGRQIQQCEAGMGG